MEGSARGATGINEVRLLIWATVTVPGDGVFSLISVNKSITVAGLQVHPGEVIVADLDGCTKIPLGHDPEVILAKAQEVREREQSLHEVLRQPGMTYARYLEIGGGG